MNKKIRTAIFNGVTHIFFAARKGSSSSLVKLPLSRLLKIFQAAKKRKFFCTFLDCKKGITLTELLVASILIGIVMIGVASFSVSIQQFQNSTNRATILSMKTMAVMNRLTRDAYLAVGDETNRGIVPGGSGNKESICFRHDTDVDPSSYTGDTWTCYFINNQDILWLCDPGLTPPVGNWGACKSGPGDPRELLDLENGNYFTIVNEAGAGPLEYIDIDLPSIFDNQGGATFHPIENPRYHLHTQVSPPGHSR